MRIAAVVMMSLVMASCSVVGNRSGTEQVDYTIVDQIDEAIEIREYGPRLVAETSVSQGSSSEDNTAFRRLFDYIQGANRGQQEIAMTAPVETQDEPPSQKIAMTTPVEIEEGAGDYRMAFFLPRSMTMATAPQPTDPEVTIRELSERTEAVLRFSGSRSDEAVVRETARLETAIAASEWQASGEPRSYFYDPPWTLPWFRRNEIAVPVIRLADRSGN